MTFERIFSMPNSHTFKMKPVADLLREYIKGGEIVVDPFARDSTWANISNDLNPEFDTTHHMHAVEFLAMLRSQQVKADIVLFDPPYSPRQISECYKIVGRKCGMTDTQNAKLYADCRDIIKNIVRPGGIVISFGWNSMGMGINRGFEIERLLLVPHGAAHNDTICMVERHKEAQSNATR